MMHRRQLAMPVIFASVCVLMMFGVVGVFEAYFAPRPTLDQPATTPIQKVVQEVIEVPKADAVPTALVITGDMVAIVQWAVPELRAGAPETNDDEDFYLAVHSAAEDGGQPLYEMSGLVRTSPDGTYRTEVPLPALAPGTYDVIFKGGQTLAKKLNDIELIDGANTLNFTTSDNSPGKGPEVLLAGDISNAGTSPATLGDNTVNSVDVSIIIPKFDVEDPSGNAERSNLNQDPVVNSVDMSILLKNLDAMGDES